MNIESAATAVTEDWQLNAFSDPHESLLSAIGGDFEAFADLCEFHSPRLMSQIRRITRNSEDAEDALQDTLLRAFLHLRDFDGRSQFSTWLSRIAINSALMLLRKRKRQCSISIDTSFGEGEDRLSVWEPADMSDDPECCLLKSEKDDRLRQGIGELDDKLRLALEVWIAQGSSPKKGARQLNISIAAFKSRVTRAKAALRDVVTQHESIREPQKHSLNQANFP